MNRPLCLQVSLLLEVFSGCWNGILDCSRRNKLGYHHIIRQRMIAILLREKVFL